MSDKNTVASKSPFYERMAPSWGLIDGLLGGTEAMRAGKEKFLPKHEGETHKGYTRRLNKGFLFEAYADAVERIVSKPFSRDVQVKSREKLNELVEKIIDNADQRGRNLSQFARDVFEDGVQYGISHVLVDYPNVGGGMSLGAERRLDLHPYFTHITHDKLFGARWELLPTGQTRLRSIRISECHLEDDGAYGEVETEYVRVINAPEMSEDGLSIVGQGTWELWKRTGKGEAENDWTLDDEGTHTFPGIPLVTFYADRKGFLESGVPLRKLAWLNLAHWQSSADQRNILGVARVGILFAAGFTKAELKNEITIGPNNYIFSSNPDAKMSYVEHTGAAIGAGRQDLEDLKADMAALSLQPVTQRTGNQTATAKAIDESKNESVAQSWVRGLENMLNEAMRMATAWVGEELDSEVAIDVHNDFGLSQRAIEDLKSLGEAYDRGVITAKTYLTELQRRGVISEDIDVESEAEQSENEVRIPHIKMTETEDEPGGGGEGDE